MKKFLIILMVVAIASFLFVGCDSIFPPLRVAVTDVTLDQETMALTAEGETGTLLATVEPTDATDTSVTWDSSAPAVATVALGIVTPLAEGTADITVITVDGGLTATCIVTVTAAPVAPVAVTGVTLDEATLAFTVGDAPVTLVAIVTPEDATDPSVTWASSDRTVAIVIAGVVTPLNAGISAVMVTTVDGGFDAICVVTVAEADEPAPEPELVLVGITVDPKEMDLIFEGGLGTDTKTITSVTATYEIRGWDADIVLTDCLFISSNLDVATVDEDGNVTAEGVGIASILVSYMGKFDTIVVTVIAVELDRISVNPSTMQLDVTVDSTLETAVTTGNNTINSVTAYYNDGVHSNVDLPDEDCTFTSGLPNHIEVSNVGVVTGTNALTTDIGTTITVDYKGKIDTIDVEVTVISSDATLKSLTVTVDAEDPIVVELDPVVFVYDVNLLSVPAVAAVIVVEAETTHPEATAEILPELIIPPLAGATTVVTVTVTAEDGSEQDYTVNIIAPVA